MKAELNDHICLRFKTIMGDIAVYEAGPHELQWSGDQVAVMYGLSEYVNASRIMVFSSRQVRMRYPHTAPSIKDK